MGRWRSLAELRQAFKESGIDLGQPTPKRPDTRQCAGKVRHPTRAYADAAVSELRMTSPDRWPRTASLGAYQCRVCAFWHVGHAKSRQQGAR